MTEFQITKAAFLNVNPWAWWTQDVQVEFYRDESGSIQFTVWLDANYNGGESLEQKDLPFPVDKDFIYVERNDRNFHAMIDNEILEVAEVINCSELDKQIIKCRLID